jgi:acyl-coenzyme A thioesterase 13
MKNNIDPLVAMKAFVGKEFTVSPSPFMLWLKPIVLSAELGKLSFQYTVRKEMMNPAKTLHGGVTAAIIDDVIGATMYSFNEDYFYTTVNMSVDYFAPAMENENIIAETSIVKKGTQITNAQCEIWNADKSRLLARGHCNLLKTEHKRSE